LAAKESVNQKVFFCLYFWLNSGVDDVSVFLDYSEASHPSRRDTLYACFCFVCWFLCLFVNNMCWKKEETKLLLQLQTHPTRNIKQA
jgi:hypothetical protein